MRALVLGGSVFVGRRLVAALTAAGHDVAVLNRGRTAASLPPEVEQLVADRTDPAQMRAVLATRSWDVVFDVSGFVMAAGGSDIEGLLDLLDAKVGHYIFVSSIMAYDQSLVGVLPWDETMPTNPDGATTYGGFKALAEASMLARHANTGFPCSVVRPAAIYGPHNNIYDMETPMFLRLREKRPILLPHDGLVSASYGHVDDLVAMLLHMVGNTAAFGEVFNATAEAVTTRRYVETLAAIVGNEPVVVDVPAPVVSSSGHPVYGHLFGNRHHAVLSTAKARSLLGFSRQFDFEAGHRHTYEWFLEAGMHLLSGPLADPVWRATWDFDAEADVAARLGWRQ